MFCGKYKVYLDGQLVAEKENSITKSGRQIILKSLMGKIPTIGASIQMGVGSTANGTSYLASAATASGSVTYTSKYSHGYAVGDTITVTGNTVPAYNILNRIIQTVPSPSTFTITSGGTGTMSPITNVVTAVTAVPTSITMTNFIGNATTTVTGTSTENHGLVAGDIITIAGATGTEQTKLNGTWTIASAPTLTTFTFVVTVAPTSGTLTTGIGATSTVRSNTYTATGHTFIVGNSVVISGSSVSGYNGTFTITAVATNTFTVLNKTIGATTWTSGLATSRNNITLTSPTTVPIIGMSITGTNITASSTITAVSGTGPYNLTLSLATSGTVSGTGTINSSGTGTGGEVQLVKPFDDLIPNTRLEFSTSQIPVTLSFLDNAGDFDAIVFKGAIPASGSGSEAQKIYELGIFPPGLSQVSSFSQTSLFGGSQSDGWTLGSNLLSLNTSSTTPAISCYITPALTAFPFRVGDNALFLFAGQTVKSTIGDYSRLSSYGSEDFISLAISKVSSSTPSITVRFYVNANVYYTFTYTGTNGKAYEILNKSLSEAVTTSANGVSPSWNSIRYVEISSDANVVVDAVRVNDNIEIDPTYGMVSRTVLNTPIVKNTSQSLEIEYYLSLTFNKTVA